MSVRNLENAHVRPSLLPWPRFFLPVSPLSRQDGLRRKQLTNTSGRSGTAHSDFNDRAPKASHDLVSCSSLVSSSVVVFESSAGSQPRARRIKGDGHPCMHRRARAELSAAMFVLSLRIQAQKACPKEASARSCSPRSNGQRVRLWTFGLYHEGALELWLARFLRLVAFGHSLCSCS